VTEYTKPFPPSWIAAPTDICTMCGETVKVWDSLEARGAGEDTVRMDWEKYPHINPNFLHQEYRDVCTRCRREHIHQRYKEQEALGFPLLKATIEAQEKLKK
jgi:hypothetical protein